ncbi:MAG: NAD(P)H-binding protein [Sandaracinaceae bacterium]|nr:NAD(P)H-binding protein [Sandaracinaceae bacterium]
MKCVLLGGSGEVGRAVARALVASDVCSKLTMIGRRSVDDLAGDEIEQVVTDTSADDFESVVERAARGHDVAISCIGTGSGTASMSEARLLEVEVVLMGKFARGCKAAGIEIFELLTAVGVDVGSSRSRVKYVRVLGKKLDTVMGVGFEKLAVFKPGTIVGNQNTPRWVTPFTALIPDALGWGNIHQDDIAKAFVAHLEKVAPTQTERVVSYQNREMKQLIGS